ncbi:MAG: hypothetical protein AB7G39_04225 [Alphaproteobacteria bacterium]
MNAGFSKAVLLVATSALLLCPASANELIERPNLDIPDGTGDTFKSLWLSGQALNTRAAALEDSIRTQHAECSLVKTSDSAKMATCKTWRDDLESEWERYDQERARYEMRRQDLWAECRQAWTLTQISPPSPGGTVNAYGCALQEGVYDPNRGTGTPRQKGLVIKEPPAPLTIRVSAIPRKEVMRLGADVAKLVFDALDSSVGDLRNGERILYRLAQNSAAPQYDVEQAASYLTGMRYAAELVGASPRAPSQADLDRFFLPKDAIDRASLAGNFVPERISRPDEPSTLATVVARNQRAEEALRAAGGDVNLAIQRLEREALEQPISPTHLALRTLQGIHVYISVVNLR